jgi:hypothetical protein
MDSIPTKKKADIYLKCIRHLSTQLRGHAGLEPGAVSRATHLLRTELEDICMLGGKLPQVANLDHAEHGLSNDFSTLVDVAEITFDTLLSYPGISRGRRYKSNEFASALERSFQHRNQDLSLEYASLKATLDIRTRQLGCLLSAAGTMFLAPLELRTLLLSLLTEDLLEGQNHLFAHIHERPKLLAEVLLDLGLSGIVLAQHFANSLQHTPASQTELRCDRFQELMESLGLDSPEFQRSWVRIKQSCFSNRQQPAKQFRDDGQGGWEEQLKAGSNQNSWTTWVPVSPRREVRIGKRYSHTN